LKDGSADATHIKMAFALMLETACEDFENLLSIIDGEIRLVTQSDDGTLAGLKASRLAHARFRIPMALAKSFLFNANRANRVCFKNKAALAIDREERERFLKATEVLSPVRDVNEHGFDGDRRSEKNKPSLHEQGGGLLDETSLVVEGREKILMGPLNLYTIYLEVKRMRDLAGFQAVARRADHDPPL